VNERSYNIFLLCQGSSGRLIVGEEVPNKAGSGRSTAFSTGTHPIGAVQPHDLGMLHQQHHTK